MGLQVVTAQDQERWIERNTIRCERFDARLSAEACDEIRKRDPDRCLGCRRAKPNEKREPTAFEQSQRKGQERRRKEGYTYKSGTVPCRKCQEKLAPYGRGLCRNCYSVEFKAGRIENWPKLRE